MANYAFQSLIDFTRTSSATYVDATGKIVSTPASRNLLTFTQEFDNAVWIKGGGAPTVTANSIAAPDGTMTADTISQASSTNAFSVSQIAPTATIGLPYTWSIYLKQGTSRYTQLTFSSSSFGAVQYANIDLQTGTVTQSPGSPTVAITSAGNGWYRVAYTATATAAAAATPFIVLINSPTDGRVPTITGSSANTLYAWGAQLEQASTATDYTRNNGGVYPPRFDYDPVTLAPRGLLVEEQRTNLFTNSEFPNGLSDVPTRGGNVSTSTFSLLSGNTGLAIDNTGSVTSFAYKGNFTTVNGTTYTISAFVRMGDGNAPSFVSSVAADSANSFALVVASNAINPLTYVVTAMGNGFYRVSATVTAASASSNNGIVKYGTNDSRSLTVSGYQLEAGSFATSYIPTVASQVTRTADVATITGANFSQFYNQSEGTFVAEFDTISTLLASSALSVDDATNNNFIRAGRVNTTGRLRVFNGGVSQADVLPANAPGWAGVVKIAAAFKANDFAASVSGGAVATGTSGTIPAVTQLRLGTSGGGDPINGHIRSIQYYNTRLPNAQLQALTA